MKATASLASDEISTFLPGISDGEHERRAKLRSYRNAASAMLGSAKSDTAKHLAWAAIEWASPNLYSPADVDWLDQVNLLCKRLLVTAMQVEDMALAIVEASDG